MPDRERDELAAALGAALGELLAGEVRRAMKEALTESPAGDVPLRVYTLAETARVLRVGATELQALVNSGRLRSYRNGRRRYVTEAAIREFVEAAEAREREGG